MLEISPRVSRQARQDIFDRARSSNPYDLKKRIFVFDLVIACFRVGVFTFSRALQIISGLSRLWEKKIRKD